MCMRACVVRARACAPPFLLVLLLVVIVVVEKKQLHNFIAWVGAHKGQNEQRNGLKACNMLQATQGREKQEEGRDQGKMGRKEKEKEEKKWWRKRKEKQKKKEIERRTGWRPTRVGLA